MIDRAMSDAPPHIPRLGPAIPPEDPAEPRAPRLRPPRFVALRCILALVLREMGSTYGRSPGGYLWAILEPLGAILLLSLGFSLLVRAPSLGTSFLLFYATGYLPFSLFTGMHRKTAAALKFSKALLAYPRVIWLDAIIARAGLTFLTDLTVFCILVPGILLVAETRTVIDIGPILTGIGMAAIIGLAIGTLNCLLFAIIPVWVQIFGILTRPLFLASGVFFIYEDMPPVAQDILWWNPLLHAVGEVRRGFYPTYEAAYVSVPYGLGLGLAGVALGLLLLRRHHARVLNA
jgi:capsular polysaccharide transport system permease protein